MAIQRSIPDRSATRPAARPAARSTGRAGFDGTHAVQATDTAPEQPPIWVEGRQAPAFDLRTYGVAGLLLTREAGGGALLSLSARAGAWSDRIGAQDWSGTAARLGRVGRWLPTAGGTSRALSSLSQSAEAARRLLFALPELQGEAAPHAPAPTPEPVEPTAAATGPEPLVRRRPGAPETLILPPDPDLAAIRAMLNAEREAAARPEKARWKALGKGEGKGKVRSEARPGVAATNAISRLGRWIALRLMAGGALALAAPLGYGLALWRHLDGTDLREIVEDCRQPRTN